MTGYDSTIHHRRSIRLKGYDYSEAGAYFVTVVTQRRAALFGKVVNGEMQLNRYGEIVQKW
jgi:putative transposase